MEEEAIWNVSISSEHEDMAMPACIVRGDVDCYLDKEDLEGAICLADLDEDEIGEDDMESPFNSRIRLKDGRIVYMMSIDLDWGEQDGL